MGQKILAQVQLWTIFLALPLAIVLGLVESFNFGVGVFLTALWAVAGLRALEGLIRTGLRPKGVPKNRFEIILWVLAKIAVYAIAVWVMFTRPVPPTSHFIGFSLMMLVLIVVGARTRAKEIRHESQES